MQGSGEDFEPLRTDIEKDGTAWTVLKNARHADQAFFYIIGPVAAFVGNGIIISDVWTTDEEGSP